MNKQEKEIFEKYILPTAQTHEKFVLITTNPTGGYYSEIVGHEILHAQYFLNEVYRNTVDDFWNTKVSDASKTTVKRALSSYDTTNDYVMKNEFQAYILMYGAENFSLRMLVSKYGPTLRATLKQNGTPAVEILNPTSQLLFKTPYNHLKM